VTGTPEHTPERAVARVDLGAIERNCAHLRALLSGGAELCAVVKADGYGHGAVWAAKAALAGGADWLAVASAEEAVELRRHGLEQPILVMGVLTGEDARAALEAEADVVAWRAEFVDRLAALAAETDGHARVHVKLDTGMGRLGTPDAAEARAVADAISAADGLELVGAMTHFGTADELGDEHFPAQLATFADFVTDLKQAHPDLIAHAANSAAVYRDPDAHFDMARCGVAIYGLDPFQRDPAERGLEPALSLSSHVGALRRFEPGESAGYGRSWSAREPTFVATVPIGYGDGYRRAHSDNGELLVRGRRYPLVGTVSMDNVTVDLGAETDAAPGDEAVLIGAQGDERILAEQLAAQIGTINYEITCALTPRVRRAYEGGR